MIALNLDATTAELTMLKEYLQNNAGEVLAEKINSGVFIEKDGKRLLSKKSLASFMNYACERARKEAEKGARFACIDHATVFGWAIHYFEEDSIAGTLFNEDGTEYKPPKPVYTPKASAQTVIAPPPPKPKPQMSLFDLMDGKAVDAAPKESEAPDTDEADEPEETESDADEGTDEADEPEESEESEEPAEDDCGDEPVEAACADEPDELDEQDIPSGLRQISETQMVDDDGIMYTIVPRQEENPLPDALACIFGDLLIVR
ncbi:MAG: PcfK-like family protein [Firmicutes bacterium]|nr:PcfK-like family protein [Bacillota bacterium]